jgi:hypothetical protein
MLLNIRRWITTAELRDIYRQNIENALASLCIWFMVGKVLPVQVYGGQRQSITSTGLWWAQYHQYRFMVGTVSPVQVSSLITAVFPCHYHSTTAPLLINLSTTDLIKS